MKSLESIKNENFYSVVVSNGGITFDLFKKSEPSSGYVVATGKQPETIQEKDFTVAKLATEFNSISKDAVKGDCFGAWLNEGLWYLEKSKIIDDLDQALSIARQNNQIAIYDVANNEEIKL